MSKDTLKSWDLMEGFGRYQRAVTRTMKMQGKRDAVIEGAFGLAGEAGEVVDRIKKFLYQGHTKNIKADLVEELGDVLWYLTDLCTLFDIELSQIVEFNIAKLLDRYPDGFSAENSRARVDLRESDGQIGGVRICDNGYRQDLQEEHNIEPGIIHYGTDIL